MFSQTHWFGQPEIQLLVAYKKPDIYRRDLRSGYFFSQYIGVANNGYVTQKICTDMSR